VTGHYPVRRLLVEADPPFHPGQRFFWFASGDEQRGDGVAILSYNPCLLGECDVGLDVLLSEVEHGQSLAPTSADVLRAVLERAIGCWLRPCCALEVRTNQLRESGEACLVEDLDGVFFKVAAEFVGIIVHPSEQTGRSLVRVGASCLPSLDPSAEQLVNELPEAAARIVDLFSLLMAAGKERLVQCDGSGRIGVGQLRDLCRNLVEVAHEMEARSVVPLLRHVPGSRRRFRVCARFRSATSGHTRRQLPLELFHDEVLDGRVERDAANSESPVKVLREAQVDLSLGVLLGHLSLAAKVQLRLRYTRTGYPRSIPVATSPVVDMYLS